MTQCSGWQSPGWSNPNLLINWDFRNPVNQRGQTSYATEMNIVYSLDCWQIGGNGSLNIEDGYIRVVRKTDFENIFQKIEKISELAGKTIIFSACIDGQANMTFDVNGNYPAYAFRREEGIGIMELSYTLPEDLDSLEVIIQPPEDNMGFDLYAIKLEVGSISTLALDLMQPSDYAAELRKCQRYFQKGRTCRMVTSKTNYDNDTAITDSEKLSAMRIEPTITLKDIWVPGYYDINQVDSTKFAPKLCSLKDNKSFYVSIEKQGMDNFDNLLGRCIIFDYEASAEL